MYTMARFQDVYAYDPPSNTWSPRNPMPTPRAYLGVGVINGLVYAVGGDNEGRLATLEAYDPVADSWSARAPCQPRVMAWESAWSMACSTP